MSSEDGRSARLQFTDGDVRELLTILAAGCSEAAVRVLKAQWFGLDDIPPGQLHDNATRLGHKMGEIIEVLHRAVAAGLIPLEAIDAGRAIKQRQLATFMQVDVMDAEAV